MTRIIALNPTSSPPPPEALGRRLDSLRGATVGFFSNNKPNARVLLERTAAALQARFEITPRFFTKDVPSLEANEALLRQCGEGCQAVVLAALD
jgi:hypothetical protein